MNLSHRRRTLHEQFERKTGIMLVNAPVRSVKPDAHVFGWMRLAGKRIGVSVLIRNRVRGVGFVDWEATRDMSGGYEPRPLVHRVRLGAARVVAAAARAA